MNRGIKFRAKRIDTGAWVYGDYFRTPLTDENSGAQPSAGWYFLTGERRHCISSDGVVCVVDVETLGQFTGLFDRLKVGIYEGDLVEMEHVEAVDKVTIGVIEYAGSEFIITTKVDREFGLNNLAPLYIKIIGTIHDDPKLLEIQE